MAEKKLVLLDRDGVINKVRHDYVKSLEELVYIDGSIWAISRMIQSNINISICSNQRGIALGKVTSESIESINEDILMRTGAYRKNLKFFYCPHDIIDKCNCRKPKPGLLNAAMQEYNVSPKEAIFVGDNLADYHAALSADIEFHLVLTGYGEQVKKQLPKAIVKHRNLCEFFKTFTIQSQL